MGPDQNGGKINIKDERKMIRNSYFGRCLTLSYRHTPALNVNE